MKVSSLDTHRTRLHEIASLERELKGLESDDRAFIAGLLEADGCFTIYRNQHKRRSGNGVFYYYSPTIQLSNTTFSMVEYLKETLHIGNVRYEENHSPNPMKKWSVEKQTQLIAFLRQIIPFLKWKKEQAILLLEWLESRLPKYKQKRGFSEREVEIYERLRDLHHKGQRRKEGKQ